MSLIEHTSLPEGSKRFHQKLSPGRDLSRPTADILKERGFEIHVAKEADSFPQYRHNFRHSRIME